MRERWLEEVEIVNLEVGWISKDEVRTAMKRMKSGKAVGPDGLPVEAWKCLGEMAVGLLTRLFNKGKVYKMVVRPAMLYGLEAVHTFSLIL